MSSGFKLGQRLGGDRYCSTFTIVYRGRRYGYATRRYEGGVETWEGSVTVQERVINVNRCSTSYDLLKNLQSKSPMAHYYYSPEEVASSIFGDEPEDEGERINLQEHLDI